jgi:acyl-CoA reductase-like NAD-dependent aldehyde dehydrogenase
MADFKMLIAGSSVPGLKTFGVVDPATEEVFAEAPECTAEQLDEAMNAAQAALADWAADEAPRRKALLAIADVIDAQTEELAEILTHEQGKPLRDARFEIVMTAGVFRYYAGLDTQSRILKDDETALIQLVRRPMGVVAAITPWNYPLALLARKVAPGLLAGNTLVVKPSPYTPLSTLGLGAAIASTVPAGVLNVVSGSDELGAWMTSHPVPRKITFTGSVATGRAIAVSAAPDLKRLTLELGGNDPAIVLEDADIAAIAPKIFLTSFVNNGQVCSVIKRVYVHESLHDQLVEALVEQAKSVTIGNGVDDPDFGPLNNKPQLERVMALVADARDNGAIVAVGGNRPDRPGYFFEPTIVADASDGTRLVDEEQFGPALPVLKFTDVDDVIRRANNTNFGLDASVWGTDLDRVANVGNALECGTVWMNTHAVRLPEQPTGGLKWSGMGLENGPWGYEDLTELQVFYEAR